MGCSQTPHKSGTLGLTSFCHVGFTPLWGIWAAWSSGKVSQGQGVVTSWFLRVPSNPSHLLPLWLFYDYTWLQANREGGVPLTEPKEILPEIRMCRLISHTKAHKMELSSKKMHPRNCRSEPGKGEERSETESFQMITTFPMLDHSKSKMLLEWTNANKKVQGNNMYKVIIKPLHGSKKPQPKLSSHLFTEVGNRGCEGFNAQKTSKRARVSLILFIKAVTSNVLLASSFLLGAQSEAWFFQ